MSDDDIQRVVTAINKLRSDVNAHQVVIMALAGQLSGMTTDWRERLQVMRENCERAVSEFPFADGEAEGNNSMRQQSASAVGDIFDRLFAALAAREQTERRD